MLTTVIAALLATQAVAQPVTQAEAAPVKAAEQSADIASEALSAGRGDEAIAVLERTRAKHASDPAVLINLGVAYAHRGENDRARGLFKAAMASDTVIDLETADGKATNSRKLARKALSMLDRGELRMAKASVQR